MSFTISYDIKANDHFTKVSDKIILSAAKMDLSMRKVAKSAKLVNKNFVGSEAAANNLEQSYKKISFQSRMIDKNMKSSAVATTELKRKTKSLDNALGKLNKTKKKTNRSFKEDIGTMRATGAQMSAIGRTVTTRVALPMIAAGVAAFKMSSDMNEGMSTIATLMPGQTQRVQQLKSEIQSLSMETGIATGDLTAGAYSAISAWGDSAETMERMRVVAQASKAGLASTSETLGLLSSMTEIYGDNSAEATQRVADLAFVTNKLAIKAPFAEMASSMGRVAPLAKQIGVSQERLFATLAANAGVTGSVSEVSTQMASLYTSVIKTTPAMEKVIKKTNKNLGTSYKTAADAMKGLGDIEFLKQIQKNTKGTKGMAEALGGRKEGLILALSLINSRSAKYNEVMTEMHTKTGQMTTAYKEFVKTNAAGEKWKRTQQKMIVTAQRMGDILIPVADKIMDRIEGTTAWLDRLDPSTVMIAKDFAFMALKIGVMLYALGKVNTIVALAAPLLGGIGTSATAAATGVTVLKTAMLKLNIAVLAGMVAYQGLKFAWDAWENKGGKTQDKLTEDIDEQDYSIIDRKSMEIEELKKNIQAEKNIQSQLPKGDMSANLASPDKFMQMWHSNFNDDVLRPIDEAEQRREKSIANVAMFENQLKTKMREKEDSEMAGLSFERGGGVKITEEPSRIKIVLDVNDPSGVIAGADAKGDKAVDVDFGENLRD